MGLRLVPLYEDHVALVADNDYWVFPESYYDTTSVEEAMEYFHLYLDENNELRRRDLNKELMDRYGIFEGNTDIFLQQLEELGNSLSKEDAIEHEFIFLDWMPGKFYETGHRVYYSDGVYECLRGHTAHRGGTPWDLPKFWKKLAYENKVDEWYPESNYAENDKVMYLNKVWFSKIDGNNDIPGETDSWVTFGL